MYTIGQVSEMFELPVSTLRYYDKEGLFPDIKRISGKMCIRDRHCARYRVQKPQCSYGRRDRQEDYSSGYF